MNSNLISKNISGYFDDLINKPIIIQPAKQSTMSTFYKNYVEHNLLLIIIIIFIIIFLIFKYFSKNSNNDKNNDDEKDKKKEKKKIEKEKEKKLREKINKERELLEKEKSEILSIIDELSEINYKRNNQQYPHEENNQKYTHEENNQKVYEKKRINNENKRFINQNNIDYEAYTNNQNYSDDYYDLKENKSELIDGIYFETPYN
jgi:hypothetical protein